MVGKQEIISFLADCPSESQSAYGGNRRSTAEREAIIRTYCGLLIVGYLFLGFDLFVWNFDGFSLPRSRPRELQGQAGALLNLVLKQARFGVEAGVSDLATIVSTHGELLVAGVVAQASDILPSDLLFPSQPRTRSNAIHLHEQNRPGKPTPQHHQTK